MRTKLIVSSFAAAAAISAVAAVKSPKPAPTIAERKAAKAAAELKCIQEEGGEVIRPGTMKGWILIANAQKLVDPFEIEEVRDYLWNALNFNINVQPSEKVTPATVGAVLKRSGAAAGLFLVEDPDQPVLLVAPEDHWAIVNVTKLAEGAKTPKYVEMRIKKETVRGFAMVCGGAGTVYSDTIVSAIKTPADLDRHARYEMPIDVLMRFNGYMKRLGVTRAERMPYTDAVYEDWCPAPTNAVQKRLWDEAHALPTNPIKIVPPNRKK